MYLDIPFFFEEGRGVNPCPEGLSTFTKRPRLVIRCSMVPDCRAKANRRAALHKGAFHHQLVMENHSKFIEERTKSFKSKCFELLAFLDKALFKEREHKTGVQSYLEFSVVYA